MMLSKRKKKETEIKIKEFLSLGRDTCVISERQIETKTLHPDFYYQGQV